MNEDVCSAEHAKRLKALHKRDPQFGIIGNLWAARCTLYMVQYDCDSILDYGCGRSNLVPKVAIELHALDRPCTKRQEYDPATAPCVPEPADFISCIDVMEHVESDKVDAVLSHIHSLMLKCGIITISLRNGTRKNKDTHPNVRPREWWLEKLSRHFLIKEIPPLDLTKASSELATFVEPKP